MSRPSMKHLRECGDASRAKPESCKHEARERQGGMVACADCFTILREPTPDVEKGERG